MKSFEPKDLSISKMHKYLLNAVAPRPIALASTLNKKGVPNLSPFSYFNVFSANPPILIFSPARRVRDNTTKDTLKNVETTKEVVINMVNYDMVHQMSLSSAEYPEDINEFEKAGFTMLDSHNIRPFRVGESPVQFECKVSDIVKLGKEGGAGNLIVCEVGLFAGLLTLTVIVCEVVKMHFSTDILKKDKSINQEKLDLVARAGGNYYSRAKSGFFEIPKPLSSLGIGVDSLPEHVRNSMILTGNDLGMLGNVEELPTKKEVDKFIEEVVEKYPIIRNATHREKHKIAQNYLSYGDVQSALKLLLS